MNTCKLLLCAALASVSLLAQTPTEVSPDEVVVSVGEREFTAGHIARIRASLPEQFKKNTAQMDNKTFLETFGYLQALAKLAEDENVLEVEPYKSQFEFNRTNFLAQIYLTMINSTLEINDEDVDAYYEQHKNKYTQLRLSAIYLNYTPIPELAEKQGNPVVAERDAWEKAESLALQLRQGADFAELAREHSDDKTSAEKGGDLGLFKPDAPLSDAIKEAVFKLQPGQVSAPVKDGGRYLLFKATEAQPRPLHEVKIEVLQAVQGEKLSQRLDEIRSEVKVVYPDQEYLQARPTP